MEGIWSVYACYNILQIEMNLQIIEMKTNRTIHKEEVINLLFGIDFPLPQKLQFLALK